ncbi:MAG: N,N-dimethylformamidase beta subunit family domain-containing protein [Acidobacteriota bacterium]
MKPKNRVKRRDFVKAMAGVAAMPTILHQGQPAPPQRDNWIVQENSHPGTLEWQLQYTSFDNPITMASSPLIRNLRCPGIEGFVSKTSARPGESLDLSVSLRPAGGFLLDIYRMGYYGGKGARHMVRLGPFRASPQPIPMMTAERLRECRWERSAQIEIPRQWPSGVYLGKLTRDEPFGIQSYVIFVVKDNRKSEVLCQVSDLTWQAYNKWPGRDSLYDDGTTEVWYTGPNVRVSFDRPYAKYGQIVDAPLSTGSGEFLLWEHPMVFWLEQQGYGVTYCSNLDLELDPAVLQDSKVFLSVGHDEYWSRKMFQEALRARDDGLSLAFFSGNSVYHEIIFYDNSQTGARRAFARKGPAGTLGNEDELMGVKSYGPGYGDWVVTSPEHWIYERTGLRRGDRIPAIIGWEYHGTPAAIPGLEVVASSPLFPPKRNDGDDPQQHAGVVYPCPKGNFVFNAGTIWWSEGLSQPPGHIPARVPNRAGTFGVDQRVQRITSNLLDRMIREGPRR